MIKLPKIETRMDRYRSLFSCLVLSAMIAAAPVYESAWAKDGNSGNGGSGSGGNGGSGSGGNSGKGGGNSGKGRSGEGTSGGSSTVGSTVSSKEKPSSEIFGRAPAMRSSSLKARQPARKKRVLSPSELQTDFQHAQLALKEAELNFNRALADPKADLRKLEQAIRNAELALSTVGARLAVAAAGK
jgi:hypothetical protein